MVEPDAPTPGWADTALALGMLARAAWRVRIRREGLTRSRRAGASRGAATGGPAPSGAFSSSPSPGDARSSTSAPPGAGSPPPGAGGGTGDRAALDRARQLAAAVRRAGRLAPVGPSCLTRSLALKELLDARGLEGARVRVGVRREESRFEAHAWVEYAGRVLDDPAHGRGDFATLEGLEVTPDR